MTLNDILAAERAKKAHTAVIQEMTPHEVIESGKWNGKIYERGRVIYVGGVKRTVTPQQAEELRKLVETAPALAPAEYQTDIECASCGDMRRGRPGRDYCRICDGYEYWRSVK